MCVLDIDSEYYGVFGSIGKGDGQFTWAASIAVDRDGKVYVGDEFLNRISIFDEAGVFLGKWGVPGSGPGEIDGPCGLAFDANDDLYVSDHRNTVCRGSPRTDSMSPDSARRAPATASSTSPGA